MSVNFMAVWLVMDRKDPISIMQSALLLLRRFCGRSPECHKIHGDKASISCTSG